MSAPVWVTPAGFIGTLTERVTTLVKLEAYNTDPNIVGTLQYQVIAGNLPPGMYLDATTGNILGTPQSVSTVVESQFVVRAQNSAGKIDRTFSLSVSGPTAPTWVTGEGSLPVGRNGEHFCINRDYVDYALRAEIDVLRTGKTLNYYIADNQGQLPPGLELTPDGRIKGYVDDELKLDNQASLTGGYDTEYYDRYPFEHGQLEVDISQFSRPESITKTYEFYVTVTDGLVDTRRKFTIQVVDPNSLRSDNTYVHSDNSDFDTSAGYLLSPLWKAKYDDKIPKIYNLGAIRASRYQILPLYIYDPYPFTGSVSYDWSLTVNPEVKLTADSRVDRYGTPTKNLKGDQFIYVKTASLLPVKGMKLRLDQLNQGFDATTYTIISADRDPNSFINARVVIDRPLTSSILDQTQFYVGTDSMHPPGLDLEPNNGELYGSIAYQPAYDTSYKFTVTAIKQDNLNSSNVTYENQIYILKIKGNINSSIRFVSTGSVGSLIPGQISELKILAENINSDYSVEFDLIGGKLPDGLTLLPDGTLQGKVNHQSQTYFDLTKSSNFNDFKIDNSNTSIDKNWYFRVRARDVYRLTAVEKDFYVTVNEQSLIDYSRIFVKPFLPPINRIQYRQFITNTSIFDPTILYRPIDPEFGAQPSIRMPIEIGLQKVDVAKIAQAMLRTFKRKRFYFGDIKSIPAKDTQGNIVYELVYIDIIDNQMSGNTAPADSISVSNMQHQIESIALDNGSAIMVDDRLWPRWMTTLDENTGVPIGFIKAVVICYALPGYGEKIISRIKTSGFDFKNLDFDTDRLIIDYPFDTTSTSWLSYPNN